MEAHFPINPTDPHKLGQKTQPCKSSLPGVIFKFISKTEYYKNITEDPTKTLPNGFKKVLNGPSIIAKHGETTTITQNSFQALSNITE